MVKTNLEEKVELDKFRSISLEEMDAVKLMDRTDTKFVFKRDLLPAILDELSDDYRVLTIKENKISTYKTLYFDTPKFRFFLDHHNGRNDRFKVRVRNYVQSGLFFLEIKNKVKGRTVKNRMQLPGFEKVFAQKSEQYVANVVGEGVKLEAKLWNTFDRITLVNRKRKERLTLDLNLSFDWDGVEKIYSHLVIAELKQENADRNSPFYALMKRNMIRTNSISKYCVGAVELNPNLKYNNFKSKIILIDKLI